MSTLIDSILHNYYVPPLVFTIRKVSNRTTRICIDGKQRLTSLTKFMNNEIPHIVYENKKKVLTFYDKNKPVTYKAIKNEEIRYLSLETAQSFNAMEMICAEYQDLTEDDEYEVFSRVQLGVSMTYAEKLRAHRTPICITVRATAEEFSELDEILGKTTSVFQFIMELYLTLSKEESQFKITHQTVLQFATTFAPVNEEMKASIDKILTTLLNMVRNRNAFNAFKNHPGTGTTTLLKTIELLLFCEYIYLLDHTRSLDELAHDLTALRKYLYDHREGRLYVGKPVFNLGMAWIKARLHVLDGRMHVNTEEAPMTPTSDDNIPPNKSMNRVMSISQRRGGKFAVPTARRGGKNSFSRRHE
ncbi:hypothetical protein BDB01DRAFT_240005 [Pilobolus umbonatus]|nr:hypothetical protein BDB01DRAFT_240005 [Pilobolus umbonatus]